MTHFNHAIAALTHAFPADARNIHAETGTDMGPFWHGHKRFPQVGACVAMCEVCSQCSLPVSVVYVVCCVVTHLCDV